MSDEQNKEKREMAAGYGTILFGIIIASVLAADGHGGLSTLVLIASLAIGLKLGGAR